MNKKLFKILIISLICLLISCVSFVVVGCNNSVDLSGQKTATVNFYVKGEKVSYQIVSVNQTLKTPNANIPDGYTVDGWFFDENEWTVEYTNDNLATLIDNGETQTNVYAKLVPVSYEISYADVKDVDVSSFPTHYSVESETITLPEISVDYYVFDGWFVGGQRIEEIASGSFGDKALSAKFTPIDYTITYNGTKGATNGNPEKYNVESSEIMLSPIAKDGYKFEGWYKDGNLVSSIPANSHGEIELTVRWSPVNYSITYAQTLTADTSEFPQSFTIESQTITLPDLSVDYYVFEGWYIDGQKVEEIAEGSIGDKEISAKLTPIDYTITYSGTKGAINGNPEKYNFESSEITLSPIAKEGYKFEGWYKDGTLVSSIPANSHGEIGLTATWSLVNYTITYDRTLTADTSEFPKSFTIESETIVLPESVTVTCREFKGWTLNGNVVTEIPSGTCVNIVLFATFDVDHSVVTDEYVAPTCEATGKTEGTHCDRCNEVIVAQNSIPALGHDYKASWEWEEFSSAKVSLVCQHDISHILTVSASVTSATVQPTCDKEGMHIYTARATNDGIDYSDTKTQAIETVPHNYVAHAEVADTHSCSMCNQEFDHVDAEFTGVCDLCNQKYTEIISIESNYDLLDVDKDMSATYVLRKDIKLEGNWSSLGSESKPFTGRFYGNGFAIIGLTLYQNLSDGGLFVSNKGLIEGLTLKNLTVGLDSHTNAPTNITGGGIAAFNYGTIRNCKVEGTSRFYAYNRWQNNTKTHVFTGGAICGINYKGGVIEDCEVGGTLTSDLQVKAYAAGGGLVNAYSTLVSNIYYGNIAGVNEGTIKSCKSSAEHKVDFTVSASSSAGADVAKATMNCYIGSLVGENRAKISACSAKSYVENSRSVTREVGFGVNSNVANISVPQAAQYEGMIGVNTSSGTIEKFAKL